MPGLGLIPKGLKGHRKRVGLFSEDNCKHLETSKQEGSVAGISRKLLRRPMHHSRQEKNGRSLMRVAMGKDNVVTSRHILEEDQQDLMD